MQIAADDDLKEWKRGGGFELDFGEEGDGGGVGRGSCEQEEE